ncbi:MAG: hypothetical protein JNL83_01050 [Myxococcales bacterium]|nr:hypothetical protein [Myxococcales bacterium]
MRNAKLLLSLSLVSLGLVACTDDPPHPQDVRKHITDDLGHVLRETAAAAEGTESLIPTGSMTMLERALGQGGASAASSLLTAPEDPADPDQGFDADAIVEQLNTKVFIAANEVEPGIYKVPADLACEQTTYDDLGTPTTAIDPDCAASWDKVGLRIRVEEDGSTLVMGIQLGASHDEPLEISLSHTTLSVSVDLDEAEDAAAAIATAFGEQAPNADLSGKVTGTLTVLGAAHVGVDLTIDRALQIAVAEQGASLTGPDAFRLASAASHVLDLDLDGTAGAGAIAVDLGATTLHLPDEDGAMDLDLPGASFAAHAGAGGALQIDNISLGDRTTTLSKNGAVGVAIDLNPTAGRSLDATITSAGGAETIEVSPKLDLRISTNHAVLGDEMGMYDVTGVLLDGKLRASDASDQIEVVSGTFSIATNPASFGFTANAGQCVLGEETTDPQTFESYTQWTVGTCQ